MSMLYEFETTRMAGSGLIIKGVAGEALGDRKLVYLGGGGMWRLADADLAATMPVFGLTMMAANASQIVQILIKGFIGLSTWTWTVGGEIYASIVSGELSQVAPVAPDIVQIVGIASEADIIYFNSDLGSGGGGGTGECAILEGHTAYVGWNTCREPHTNYFLVDGTADDVQIQAALAYVSGLGGGSVLLEAGNYDVTVSIAMPVDVVLEGVGEATEITTDVNGIIMNDRSEVRRLKLVITTGATYGILADNDDHIKIIDVHVYTTDDIARGITISNSHDAEIHRCNVDGFQNGITLYYDTHDVTIHGCTISNITLYGILVLKGYNYIISNNRLIDAGADGRTAISISNTHGSTYDVTIDSNIITYTANPDVAATDGIIISGEGNSPYFCRDVAVTGNVIFGGEFANCGYGIYTHGRAIDDQSASEITITGNIVRGFTGGITITYSQIITVTANNVERCQEYGIYPSGSSDIIIDGNTVMEVSLAIVNTYSAVWLQSSDGCIVSSNRLSGGDYGVEETGVSDYNSISDNDMRGSATGSLALIGAHTSAFHNKVDGTSVIAADTAVHEVFMKVSGPDGSIGTHPCIILTDGITVTVYDQIAVPMEYQELVTAQVIVVPGGNGNMRRSVNTNWGKMCSTEDYNAQTDTIAAGVVAVLIDDMTCLDISAALTAIAAGDLVGVEFARIGGDGTDTVNADCYYLGLRVRYI